MNLSVVPSSFSPPAPPDIYDCDRWFAYPTSATYSDCVHAFNQLPDGSAPIYWKTTLDPHDPYSLPYTETYGTCQIQLMVSGRKARDVPWVRLSGVEVRHMAGWVMDQCVSVTTENKRGGYITKGLANTINYLTRPDISYEDEFPTSTNFMSLLVWNSNGHIPGYNPGNQDKWVAEAIVDAMATARNAQTPGSEAWNRMDQNCDFFEEALDRMDHHDGINWWEGTPVQSGVLSLPAPASNRTATTSNQLADCLRRAGDSLSLKKACLQQQQTQRLQGGNVRSSGGRITS